MTLFYKNSHDCRKMWKGNFKKVNPKAYKFISLPGKFRPMHLDPRAQSDQDLAKSMNTPYLNSDPGVQNMRGSNEFRARPIKHWRKQYGQQNNRQSHTNSDIMQNYDSPGGYMINESTREGISDDYPSPYPDPYDDPSCSNCEGQVTGLPDHMLNFSTNDVPCASSGSEYDHATCSNVKECAVNDIPSIARKRVRYSYNNRPCNDNSYFSYHQYMYARCQTYDQNISTNCPNGCGVPPKDKEDLEKISSRILSNEEEVKRMTHQLISEKLLSVYKEKINKKVKKTTYEKYIELAYKKND